MQRQTKKFPAMRFAWNKRLYLANKNKKPNEDEHSYYGYTDVQDLVDANIYSNFRVKRPKLNK